MPDMLVKLYQLPEIAPIQKQLATNGIEVRRPFAPEKHIVIDWVKEHFGEGWASECEASFANQPISCYIAVQNQTLIGFACYDATCRNFFGPTGVSESARNLGIGKGLLLACLHAMHTDGYAYAIIGGAGPTGFYSKVAGAEAIEGSSPGIYKGMLTR